MRRLLILTLTGLAMTATAFVAPAPAKASTCQADMPGGDEVCAILLSAERPLCAVQKKFECPR